LSLPQFFCSLEEMLWAIEVCKGMGKPIAASMCIGPEGDSDGNTPGECAVAMTKAGQHFTCSMASCFNSQMLDV
jgi:hypothetical protein